MFEIGKRIIDLAEAQDGFDYYDEIVEVIHELKEYTVYHFGYEEDLMVKFNYENYEKHKFEHYFVIKKIEKLASEDFDEKQDETIMNLVKFISDWISNHILYEDMRYKNFFTSKGVR